MTNQHLHLFHHHEHRHGAIAPEILTSELGISAVKWSFWGLIVTALLQLGVAVVSGSVALLADTIHNFGDAATAIPLWFAFSLSRWKPTARFPSGYHRVEDLAGVGILVIIFCSAVVTGYESLDRIWHPQPIEHLSAVMAAAVIGYVGNESVARFRLKVGEKIGSAALVADGYHARIDGFTCLGVLIGAIFTVLGYPLADSVVGLLITAAIARLIFQSAQTILLHLLDGVEPEIINAIEHSISHIPEVLAVPEIQARWMGHQLQANITIAVDPTLSLVQSDAIANQIRQQLHHHLSQVAQIAILVKPFDSDDSVSSSSSLMEAKAEELINSTVPNP